ncbi:MAG: hypothetical protein V4587_09365 [Acidobacteriota bacterium]
MSAIDVAGLAVAYPIGIGMALVEGVLINYIVQPRGNPVLIFTGVAFIMTANILSINSSIASRREYISIGNGEAAKMRPS